MSVKQQKGFRSVFKRELHRIVSRPIYVVLTILTPLGFLLFFSTFMQEGLPQRLPIGVIDHDNTALSRKFIRQIDATQQTAVEGHYLHFSDARAAMQTGKIFGFVEFPAHMEADILASRQPKVEFYYTEAFLIPGSLTLKNLSTMLATLNAGINLQSRLMRGQTEAESMGQILPIVPETHPIGNPYINYSVYLINVILPGLLQLMILITTVYVIGVELKETTSRKWLILADKSFLKALFGKLLPYTFTFMIMGILYDVVLFRFLEYPLHNHLIWMFLNTFLLILAAQAMGVFMIGVFPVLRDGLSFAGLYGVLSLSYSGLSFPIDSMPALLQGLSYVFPLRYFFKAYQDIALNGLSAYYFLPNFLVMACFLLMPLFIYVRLKKAMVFQNYPKK